ncbi:MAG: hypothetical protein IJC26_03440 [Clostridia bacterium]|nr:hypothetical protein [Clostridia bacterium]
MEKYTFSTQKYRFSIQNPDPSSLFQNSVKERAKSLRFYIFSWEIAVILLKKRGKSGKVIGNEKTKKKRRRTDNETKAVCSFYGRYGAPGR